jgi:biopolymer transport protein ExbD
MAEMDTSSSGGHKKGPGVKKSKKLSTRVDLTPMVDLGFLLITFFMFTTTMSQPKAMKITTPDNSTDQKSNVKESFTMTLYLDKGDKIFGHVGQVKEDASNITQYNYDNVRDAILKFKQGVPLSDTQFMNVIIKPSDSATLRNTIDAIDEMTINSIGRFAKVDMTKEEQALVDKLASFAPATPAKK